MRLIFLTMLISAALCGFFYRHSPPAIPEGSEKVSVMDENRQKPVKNAKKKKKKSRKATSYSSRTSASSLLPG